MQVPAEGKVEIWGCCGTCHGQAEGSWLCRDIKAELLHVLGALCHRVPVLPSEQDDISRWSQPCQGPQGL